MTKYSFILMSGEKDGFLERLQELGVVDISRSVKPVDQDSQEMLARAARAKKAIETLEGIDYSKDADHEAISKATVTVNDDPVAFVEETVTRLGELKTSLANVERQMKARLPWGSYDRKALEGLKGLGYTVRYYCIDRKKFDESWASDHALQIVSEADGKVWFVTVAPEDEAYSFPVAEINAPDGTYDEAAKEAERLCEETILCKAGLLNAKDYIPAIKESCNNELVELDRYLADEAGQSAAEDHITVFTGFGPEENAAELNARFDEMCVFYISETAVEEDNPPIKLKNNRFVRMFESLTGMYGMPVYNEYDPTPVLSVFFLLFFAMCMGDAGYGLILIIFGIAVKKNWVNISMFKGIGPLISTLGTATAVVGFFLGTAFGMDLTRILPSGVTGFMITGDVMGYPAQMVLAIGIGVFHLCLAMTIKAVGYTKRFGFKENISTWGWLILILGGIVIAALAFLGVMESAVTRWAVIALGTISALGIFVFNTPGRNPLINIGAGLWDTYNMVTGILGDVLSYIRLYALGLAGGMLGAAFNDLGLMVLGDGGYRWVFFVLILLVGHLINILMSCLGAFVHPLRLNFVEYFKNAGYIGKGKAYRPLTNQYTEE